MKRLILICLVLHLGLGSADYVPVIIWGPHVQHESAVALKSHDGYEFLDILGRLSTVDTITFIVAERQLSIEDLSHCKAPDGQACFKGIRSIESKLYLPSVEDPAYVMEDVALAEADIFEINLLSSGNISESLRSRTGNYVFVNFGDANYTDETISERLTRHDHMITSLYKELLAQNDRQIMVVFTGKRNANHGRFSRDASVPITYFEGGNSTNSTTHAGYVWKTESVLLYYTSMDLEISNETTWMNVTTITVGAFNGTNTKESDEADFGPKVESPETNGTDSSASNGTNSTITHTATHLAVTISVNVDDIFKFVITTANGYWRASQFSWNSEPLSSNQPISAANGFSYHCSPAITLTSRSGNATGQNETAIGRTDDAATGGNRTDIVITWKGLQLEPKFVYAEGKKLASFNDAYDCVGFVSPGIVSGLFVGGLLMLVLFIGITCIMDIKPIDRFEDPKGPRMTFTVID